MRGKTNKGRAFSNPNLLDNPWFTINQEGQTEYGKDTTFQYSVDRWICDIYVKASYLNGKWTIRNDDTETVRGFLQRTELKLHGKTVTYSVLVDGKITSVTFKVPTATPTSSTAICYKPITDNENCFLVCWFHPDDSLVFHLNLNAGASIIPEALKLEIGSISTLHLDVPPNYAEELLKCQREFVRLTNKNLGYQPFATGVGNGVNQAVFNIHTPVPMRITPTISFSNLRIVGKGCDYVPVKSIQATDVVGNSVTALVTVDSPSTISNGEVYQISGNDVGIIDISARR